MLLSLISLRVLRAYQVRRLVDYGAVGSEPVTEFSPSKPYLFQLRLVSHALSFSTPRSKRSCEQEEGGIREAPVFICFPFVHSPSLSMTAPILQRGQWPVPGLGTGLETFLKWLGDGFQRPPPAKYAAPSSFL